jgi:hypothetical protein
LVDRSWHRNKGEAMPTRAVRFSEEENEAIKEFLKNNPFLDFSTVAKMAILKFIQKPEIQLKAAKLKKNEEGISWGNQ